MIPWIPPDDDISPFPHIETALTEPNGLLAAGGRLSTERLLMAYRNGIFPWYSDSEPILWWSPSERCVIFAEQIHISKSMQRVLKQRPFLITKNQAFEAVIQGCAKPRSNQKTTWITTEMMEAYYTLHQKGYAHSFECWQNNKLVGGLYGVQLGNVLCGESMFSRISNASKILLIYLAQQQDVGLIDCQLYTPHLISMGGKMISRKEYLQLLRRYSS